jgi:predicted alpha/beta superfamily hydrolase
MFFVAWVSVGAGIARADQAPAAAPIQPVIERHAAFPSKHVLTREVQVWLPPGYEPNAQRRYPVLYLHDGQNVFDAAGSGKGWRFDHTAARLMRAGSVAPVIIVAAAHSEARIDDYTSTAMRRDGVMVGGNAALYGRFLVEELKPFIDSRYRTLGGPANTALGGSSLGGLVTMWLLLHHPATFGAGLVVSPSVWWGGEVILRELAATPLGATRPRLWLSIGALEGDEAVAGARRLRDALLARGWLREGAGPRLPTLGYTEPADGAHNEVSWAQQVEGMLRFLYSAQ